MKKLLFAMLLTLVTSQAAAVVTLSWIPSEQPAGVTVTEYLLWCIPAERTFGMPMRVPYTQLEQVFEWQEPDGKWKCKAEAYDGNIDKASEGGEVIEYCVTDKSVNREQDPANDCAEIVVEPPPTEPNPPNPPSLVVQ